MSTLTIRNLDDGLKARLRVRAAVNGRSMEAEVREILKLSLEVEPGLGVGSRIHQRLAGLGFDELEFPRSEMPDIPDFSE